MKLFRYFLAVAVLFAGGGYLAEDYSLYAQLPPTLHRITPVDTAVDAPQPIADVTEESFAPEFGTAFAPQSKGLILAAGRLFDAAPLALSFRGRVDSAENYSIFTAFEPKSSPRHWEIFLRQGDGRLCLYLPGNTPDHLVSEASFADGKWHYFGLYLGSDQAVLYADGAPVDVQPVNRPAGDPNPDAKLAAGSLVEGGLFCRGMMDELLIQTADAEKPAFLTQIPEQPFTANESTRLLLHFEPVSENLENQPSSAENEPVNPDSLIAPNSSQTAAGENHSFDSLSFSDTEIRFPILGQAADLNPQGAKIGSDSRIEQLFPTGGIEIAVNPGDHPAKNIPIQTISREAFDQRAADLELTTVKSDDFRDGLFSFWGEQFVELSNQISGAMPLPKGAADQVFDTETLIAGGEQYPVEVVLRRFDDILQSLNDTVSAEKTASLKTDAGRLRQAVTEEIHTENPNADQLAIDFFLAAALRRNLMFLDPALDNLEKIVFLARGCYAGSRLTNLYNTDRIGGHFATQVYGFNTIHGGGIFLLDGWRDKNPTIENPLENTPVTATEQCSRLAGQKLDTGSFYAPDLSYDGKTLYFSYNNSQEHRWIWTPDTTWNIFKLTLDGSGKPGTLTQLTDSAYNDFDVCELPSGRLVFASERRGGFIRCFGEGADLRVTTSVLHSMKADGSDIYPISFFETSEWQPSVDHNGMLVYTRWDYTDRENCLGSTFWTCAPDGRNPRSPEGNYPQPWFTFEDDNMPVSRHGDHRFGQCEDAPSALPMTQMQFRAIPDSHRYIFTAAPHHGETYGSLCMLDLRVPDDNHMSRIKRLTPYTPFPESEMAGRSQYAYGSAWPISEDLYLCNRWEDLILLDRFGNEELLCERELLPIGYDPRLRLSEPIPLAARPKPPVIPQQTAQGEDFTDADKTATIGVINVHIADLPMPPNREPKRLRVIQVIPKPNPWMDTPWIGYATENTPRIPLGTVPIESDGSAYFEAPSGKQLIFQILDADNKAIQTMRAVAFVHPGEKLLCIGCHEPQDASVENEEAKATPIAFARPASKLEPECGAVEPMNFYRRIKPVLEQNCLPCHQEKNIEPTAMDHEDLRPYVFYFSGGMRGETVTRGPHGGSRSCPGRVGASESKLGSILFDENHRETVSDEVRHLLILWLDSNAPRLGAFRDEESQKQGNLVWPILDCGEQK